ncbi:putative phosphatidate phosphatase [Musca domestica]|uniref:Phosphatidate phosphatase n=1 Tax=Musca domestica TaxID=7370 RepID=A0ABM3VN19_MUSDO|nr:putative phosphatidate phosphatase [Musca domestica]
MRSIVLKQIAIIAPFAIILWLSFNLEAVLGSPRRRGFDCKDASIRQPYLADTINTRTLYLLGLYLPLISIILNELLFSRIRYQQRSAPGLKGYLVDLYLAAMPFFCGFASERFIKNLLKLTVGRLRPHSYTLCQPISLEGLTCNELPENSPFMLEYTCTGTMHLSSSIYKSFPSGHSSLSCYGLIYLALYLRGCSHHIKRNPGFMATIYRPSVILVELLCLCVAAMVAISRVFDFKHFWSDILAGALLGSIVALAFFRYSEENSKEVKRILENNFEENAEKSIRETLKDPEAGIASFMQNNKQQQPECCITMHGVEEFSL